MKKNIYCILALFLFIAEANAQDTQNEFKPINTGAANFLTMPTNARRTGMGTAGVALTGNSDAIFHNGATVLAEDNKTGGFSYTFSPWMRDYESGHSFHSIGGFYKIDKRNAILAGFRYYNYPKVEVMEEAKENDKSIRPKEMAIELGYARELFSNFNVSATFRYIYSDMGNIGDAKSANAVAFDIGAFYQREISGMENGNWAVGLQVANIGSKIKYLETKEDIPTLVKLGGSIQLPFSRAHKITIATDLGYRLLPSDIKSFILGAGAEYTLIDHFMLRGGYHYGDKNKGELSYATAGLGVNYYGVHADFSWLFAESDSPLKNTFQISVGYSF